MRQLFPSQAEEVDPQELRERLLGHHSGSKPWVVANMVMSADGSFSMDGRSGGLSSSGDKRLFHLLRGLSDVILVGAGTARSERYRRPSPDETTREQRLKRGQAERPRLALVSRSGHFPPDQPFLSGDGPDPVVFCPVESSNARSRADRSGANTLGGDPKSGITAPTVGIEVRHVGQSTVDLGRVVQNLADDGARMILCEGGPGLLGDLCAAGLLDQLFLTLAPKLVAGEHTGLLSKVPQIDVGLELSSIFEEDGFLMLNYLVQN